ISILVIQQIDGNIIAPKILGENTGVSSLCVLISILVMGDLMGLVGMLIGVPLFATVIELGKILLDKKLNEKGLSGDLDTYYSENDRAMLPDEDAPHEEQEVENAPILIKDTPSSYGNLSEAELIRLRTYAIARKHRIFTDTSDEALSEFAAEAAELYGAGSEAAANQKQGGERA
ncbi:MAG: AI-2E family transporter, partial [Ruminococcaceae bacterium]|nr:AI-2E family transporter [Oscillospiraceae bacterium]